MIDLSRMRSRLEVKFLERNVKDFSNQFENRSDDTVDRRLYRAE